MTCISVSHNIGQDDLKGGDTQFFLIPKKKFIEAVVVILTLKMRDTEA